MTPDEIVSAALELVEVLDVLTIDGPKGPQPEQLRLAAALTDLARSAREADRRVSADVAADLPKGRPVEINGRWYKRDDSPSVRGWDRDALNRRVTAAALEPYVNEDTGEVRDPTAVEAVATMWTYVAVAEGRTAKLAAIGITADEYAEVTTAKKLKEIT